MPIINRRERSGGVVGGAVIHHYEYHVTAACKPPQLEVNSSAGPVPRIEVFQYRLRPAADMKFLIDAL